VEFVRYHMFEPEVIHIASVDARVEDVSCCSAVECLESVVSEAEFFKRFSQVLFWCCVKGCSIDIFSAEAAYLS